MCYECNILSNMTTVAMVTKKNCFLSYHSNRCHIGENITLTTHNYLRCIYICKVSYRKDKGCYGLLSAAQNLGPGCYTVKTPDWSYFPKNNFSKFS